MKPEELVPDLDLCKRLKELGLCKDTKFFWYRDVTAATDCWRASYWLACHSMPGRIPAPTAAELADKLPWRILKGGKEYSYGINPIPNGDGVIEFEISYDDGDEVYGPVILDASLANALARMLIWLAEKGALK